MTTNPDSLIFDMDGTLWDNVDSYKFVWNKGLEANGFEKRVSRKDLIGLMGKELNVMLDTIIPEATETVKNDVFEEINRQYRLLAPNMKPRVYDGVLEGLEKLSEKYPLFLLSNCEEGGLVKFMNHTQTHHLITDYMEHGQNLQPKSVNMNLLKERHNLKNPFYVGDTDSDSKACADAGVPFVFVTYGFGKTDNFALQFDSFSQLTDYFLNL